MKGDLWFGDLATLVSIHGVEYLDQLKEDGPLSNAFGFTHTPVADSETEADVLQDLADEELPIDSPSTTETPGNDTPQELRPAIDPEFWFAESIEVVSEEEAESRTQPPEEFRDAKPIPDEAFQWGTTPDEPGPPLLPWSKLWPFVKRALSRKQNSRRPDFDQIIRHISKARPLRRLPRLQKPAWSPNAVLLVDRRPAMAPFFHDYDYVETRLKKARGTTGLKVIETQNLAAETTLPPSLLDSTVLALTDLGQLHDSREKIGFWTEIGKRCQSSGVTPFVLCPCPPSRWNPGVTTTWNANYWDRGNRLPSAGSGDRAQPLPLADQQRKRRHNLERLKTLISPAIRIEWGLLRAVRLLDPSLDAGTEYDFAECDEVASSPLGSSLRPEFSREHRETLDSLSPPLIHDVFRLVEKFHHYNAHIFGHMERLALHDSVSDSTWSELECRHWEKTGKSLENELDQSRAWYRDFAETFLGRNTPGDLQSRHRKALAKFALADLERLPSTLNRKDTAIQTLWASAQCAIDGIPTEIPTWVDPNSILWIDEELKDRFPVSIVLSSRGFKLHAESLHTLDLPPSHVPVSLLSSRHDFLTLQVDSSVSETAPRVPINGRSIQVPDLRDLSHFILQSDRETLHLGRHKRPTWADSWEYDAYGLVATLLIPDSDQSIRFRWIPPGRFMMGSPENEKGRYDNEGPRHEVVIPNGYWLGETPVTQEQWVAGSRDSVNPSHFQDDTFKDHPVESVSKDDCKIWMNHLSSKLPELELRLPSEEEWEFACRAGSERAYSESSELTNVDDLDSVLEKLGWFDKNSERITHEVGHFPPNAWGLHDMHGNVWEWCEDFWRDNYKQSAKFDSVRSIARGGAWSAIAENCRSAHRFSRRSGRRDQDRGFRLSINQLPALATHTSSSGNHIFQIQNSKKFTETNPGLKLPAWADSWEYDAYGMVAVLKIPDSDQSIHFRWIPPGVFTMGTDDETGHYNEEGPRHEVFISKGYWMGETQVTQDQWVAGTTESRNQSLFQQALSKNHPVESVSWDDSKTWMERLSLQLPELNLRFPTEEEWEYACRAGTETHFNDGSDCTEPNGKDPSLENLGWYDENSNNRTHEVASFPANAWGLHDMHGNVWEWCEDFKRESYDRDAKIDQTKRAIRGGCWIDVAWDCRAASRDWRAPDNPIQAQGFRLVADETGEVSNEVEPHSSAIKSKKRRRRLAYLKRKHERLKAQITMQKSTSNQKKR